MPKRRQLRGFDLKRIEGVMGLIGVDEAGRGALAEDLGDEAFAPAIAVARGGIDEVDAEVERAAQRGKRIAVGLRAPGAADRPSAEADFGAVEGMFAKSAVMHAARWRARRRDSRRNYADHSELSLRRRHQIRKPLNASTAGENPPMA